MARPRSATIALLAPLIPLLLTAGACGGSPEEQLLSNYFRAARMNDNATLGNIATVSFSPAQDGIVESFDVVRMNAEERRPLRLKEFAASEAEAQKSEEEFNKNKRAYQDSNRDAIERVLKAEREAKTLRGKDLEVQATWRKWRDDSAQEVKKLGDARKSLAAERRIADASVYDSRNPVDPTAYDGELITKDMVIKAKVRKGDAPAVDQDLHVRMERVDLKNGPEAKPTVAGRWIITHISTAGDGKTPT